MGPSYYMKSVLENGFIELLDTWGSDEKIAKYAKICKGKFEEPVTPEDTKRIIYDLMRWGHWSPFEMAGVTVRVKLPIEVARQWMRHRTFSYLERSGRYCTPISEYHDQFGKYSEEVKAEVDKLYDLYDKMTTEGGLDRQYARGILPVSMYTEFIFSADLKNLLHFLSLRSNAAAQPEIRKYAAAISEMLQIYFPYVMEAFTRYDTYSEKVSGFVSDVIFDLCGLGKYMFANREEVIAFIEERFAKEYHTPKEVEECVNTLVNLGVVCYSKSMSSRMTEVEIN